MWSPSTEPLESFAVRWQQRSRTAAGVPSAFCHRTMSSPRSVNGCGPASSFAIGMTAYQKRRSTGCCVTSMAFASLRLEALDDLQRVGLLPIGIGLEQAVGDHQLVSLLPARLAHDAG